MFVEVKMLKVEYMGDVKNKLSLLSIYPMGRYIILENITSIQLLAKRLTAVKGLINGCFLSLAKIWVAVLFSY